MTRKKNASAKSRALAVGAEDTRGTDYTLSMAKGWLNGIAHRTTLLNVNLRYSNANQFGIPGYGGDDADTKVNLELAGAIFINRSIAVGIKWRQKPDNLSALTEHRSLPLETAPGGPHKMLNGKTARLAETLQF